MLDYADDNFDHTGLNFIGGAPIRGEGYYGSGPSNITGIAAGVSATAQGSTYKASLKDYYLPKKSLVYISMEAPDLADKRSNVDLDPHFTDLYGDPLARLTQDYAMQQWYGAQYLSGSTSSVAYGILQKMGCNNITVDKGVAPGSVPLDNWPAHTRGGARIGADPSWSVFNKYGQCWTSENLFAAGEITETTGDNTTIGGTHPMGAVAYVAAEGIKNYSLAPARWSSGIAESEVSVSRHLLDCISSFTSEVVEDPRWRRSPLCSRAGFLPRAGPSLGQRVRSHRGLKGRDPHERG